LITTSLVQQNVVDTFLAIFFEAEL